MIENIELKVVGMSYNQKLKGTFSLILSEKSENPRIFSVLVGEAEAQSIALKLNGVRAPRPLTHDLTLMVLYELGGVLEKVVIYKMEDSVFFSEIYIRKNDDIFKIDARTSDAVALALRIDVPIFIESDVLARVGKLVSGSEKNRIIEELYQRLNEADEDLTKRVISDEELKKMPQVELKNLLQRAVKQEAYELAARVRDEIL